MTRTRARSGLQVHFTYDAGSQLTSLATAGVGHIQYGYDAAGNVASITDATGTTTMIYDKLGRRTALTQPGGLSMGYTYTPAGRLATLIYPGSHVVTHQYDKAGRLARLTDWTGRSTSFDYDLSGRLTRVLLPNGTRSDYGYDSAGRMVTLTHRGPGGAVLRHYELALGATGEIVSARRTEPVLSSAPSKTTACTYDAANRLTTSTTNGVTAAYAFDLDGNLQSRTRGRPDRQLRLRRPRRSDVGERRGRDHAYAYDGRGVRTRKTVGGDVTGYLRDGPQVYATLDGSGAVKRYFVGAGALLTASTRQARCRSTTATSVAASWPSRMAPASRCRRTDTGRSVRSSRAAAP